MPKLTLALLFAAGALIAGCKSNEAKPEETAPAPAAAAAATQEAAPAAKPVCPPEPATKKKTTKKTAKKADTPPADCEPAKPKTEAATAKAVETKPGAAAAPAGAGSVKTGTDCKPCVVKSRDGTFDGEVHGNIPPGSKWARLQIGMHQSEVERVIGVSNNVRAYVTGKAFIPFYFGSDSARVEWIYRGYGSLAFDAGRWGGGGVVMMINHDPKIE